MTDHVVVEDLKYPIFKKNYRAIVPYGKCFTDEHIATYGLRGTGNMDFDEDLFLKPHHVRWPIHKLADLYDEDYKLSIIHRKDCVTMYNDIVTYLGHWKRVINERSINMTVLPMDDLEKLDRFAGGIYPEGRKIATVNQGETDELNVLKDDYTPQYVQKSEVLPIEHSDEYIEILRDHSGGMGINV